MTTLEQAVKHRDCPYFGLDYYSEEWGDWFFGRERERDRIITNLRAARLTLLHAESGVGKSSLLRAGVASRMRSQESNPGRRRAPHYVPVVFSSWKDEPVEQLIRSIVEAVGLRTESRDLRLTSGPLDRAIARAADSVDGRLLVILDQFEEYFLYSASESKPERFADELARCIGAPDLPANFLIAIREDAYAGLGDLFKGRISNVYGNYLDVQYLGRDAAREAIRRPVYDVYNKQEGVDTIAIDDDLMAALLDQLRARGSGDARDESAAEDGDRVSTPYLQLVMTRLWDAEMAAGSRVLRLETLKRLGNAETIVKTHLDNRMQRLPARRRGVSADVLRFLVTPSGTKIALEAEALADFSGQPKDDVRAVLDELASGSTRVLRSVAPPPGRDGPNRYEIFHDVLAAPILDWRRRYMEARREKRLRTLAALVTVVLVGAATAIVLTLPSSVLKPPPLPGATINRPVAGARYAQDRSVTASYSCHPGRGARVTSCAGTVPNHSLLDTARPGQHAFKVNVSERGATARAVQTIAYTVPYVVLPGPSAAMQSYLRDMGRGRYKAAFDLLASRFQASNPSWLPNHVAAQPLYGIVSVGAPSYGPAGARVRVQFYARDRHRTPGSDTLCRRFAGTVQLVRQRGSWRYNPRGDKLAGAVAARRNCPG